MGPNQTVTTPHHRPPSGARTSRPTGAKSDCHGHLAEAGIQPSVGAVGSSYDNALAETIIGLYKTELIHQGKPWKTVEDVEMATARWVACFNNDRLYRHCGDIPPAQLESAHYAQHRALATG